MLNTVTEVTKVNIKEMVSVMFYLKIHYWTQAKFLSSLSTLSDLRVHMLHNLDLSLLTLGYAFKKYSNYSLTQSTNYLKM